MREVIRKETLEMIQLYKDGASLEEIGRRFGISRQAVQQRFINAQFDRRSAQEVAKSKRKNFDKEVLLDLYTKQNFSLQKIASTFHTTAQVIVRNLKEIGISLRSRDEAGFTPRTKTKELDKARLHDLYREQGLTIKEIAALYQIAHSRVFALISKYELNIGRGIRKRTYKATRS